MFADDEAVGQESETVIEEVSESENTAEEEFKPATAEIWEQIDAEAEAEKQAEQEKIDFKYARRKYVDTLNSLLQNIVD